MNKSLLGLLGLTLLIAACANEVVVEEENEGTSGTSSSSTSSSSTSSSSTSGGTNVACEEKDQDPAPIQPMCEDLDRIVLVDPVIAGDSDGDGRVEPGESATITVTMKDISGYGFNWYPGVVFTSPSQTVAVSADTWYYAILPCGEQPATATVKVDPDVTPGTIIEVQASVDMLNAKCMGTFTLLIPLEIQ